MATITSAITILNPRLRGTAIERELRAATRGLRVSDTLKADVVITTGAGTCAFQIHMNFSHSHVAEAIEGAEGLASGFERSYLLLIRPNTDALRYFQLQLSPTCSARPLLLASMDMVVEEVKRVSAGALDAAAKINRREYYRQVHEGLRQHPPHRWILAELLKELRVLRYEQEADLLLDAFGSIRSVVLQPLSSLLENCPVSGETARTLYAFFNEKADGLPLPCILCPGQQDGCRLLRSSSGQS